MLTYDPQKSWQKTVASPKPAAPRGNRAAARPGAMDHASLTAEVLPTRPFNTCITASRSNFTT